MSITVTHVFLFIHYFLMQVNHFPGSGYITNKASLVTSKLKYTPKAFQIPDEKAQLLKYAVQNPEVMWVQKSGNHRGIQIKSLLGTYRRDAINDCIEW